MSVAVTVFPIVVRLLLAGRKLATDDDILNRARALSDLGAEAGKLDAAIRRAGLSDVAREMESRAKDLDRFLTHEGPAKDGARAIFNQIAPSVAGDPAHLTGARLEPEAAVTAMIAAIPDGPLRRDFHAQPFAEEYSRKVMTGTLAVMVENPAHIDNLAPQLWRQTLADLGIALDLLERLDETTGRTEAKVDDLRDLLLRHLSETGEAQSARASGITDARIVALAQEVAADVADPEQAFRELEAAVDALKTYRENPPLGSNADTALAELRTRLEDLANAGRLHDAQDEANAALARWEAEEAERNARATQTGIAYLNEAIRRDLDVRDATATAAKIARRVDMETPDPGARFDALLAEKYIWYERGRDRGVNLDLRVAIALADIARTRADTADRRGMALNNLGTALATLGAREPGTERLEQAVAAYRAALEELTRDRVPLQWARTQMNLGAALATLGAREAGTDRLEQAVDAYRAALEEFTRDRVPLDWARTQMNLGNALQTLGAREAGTDRLDQAVDAYRAALEEITRDRVPLDWARTQMSLGSALRSLGDREAGTERLEQAVDAFRAALEERTRDRVPLDWALTRGNMALVHLFLFDKTGAAAELDRAQAALDDARGVFAPAQTGRYLQTAERVQADIDARRGG